ncbi:MAG: copper resistance protein CopB [Acidovorax sp. 17-64-282]|jgi:copper resistance protein B|nr:MAG: copper resistance protein CopB [Acidovorax sp. 35-64-16]OYZ46155.1 MAG: copper resistance protein CopB [Acidovorax sp. 16-64-162]OYZ70230.1 MAG: copper resistance protein CopB [Acidovorax sp. 24-64-9]OZA57593.1 MAG: copper resistance protein CopB [Acidovorax sp. 17-64-282]OZA68337.1 MAG: copper resistance protein CopB [Acidovorax sp. 39-64-12]
MKKLRNHALVATAFLFTGASAMAASEMPQSPKQMAHSMSTSGAKEAKSPEMDHGSMDMQMQGGSAPSDARDPHAYSGGFTLQTGPYAVNGDQRLRLADETSFGSVLFDSLEAVRSDGKTSGSYDILGRFGRDYNKFVLKAEGEVANGKLQEARTEALWSHGVATFWDAQLGLRHDSGIGPNRSWLAMGIQGLAPYWFEVDAAAYVGSGGRTALRLSADYELLLTQRLIVQPRIEANFYGKSDVARDIGKGLSNVTTGIRVRYEFTRQFAPYVGVEWANRFGQTADLARAAGEQTRNTRYVAGVRFWF